MATQSDREREGNVSSADHGAVRKKVPRNKAEWVIKVGVEQESNKKVRPRRESEVSDVAHSTEGKE